MALNNFGQTIEDGYNKCPISREVTLEPNKAITLLDANPIRQYALFELTSKGSFNLYLGEPVSAKLNNGICVFGRGNSYEINKLNRYTGKVSVVSATSVKLLIVECED